MRFVTPVKTVNSGPNRKYFGSGRGITWYNFVSDQYSGFHGIVIPGTLRDSIFVLEGLLEQQTGLNPVEIMTDTAGTSDIIFGLFWLLGYQFSPRLADAGEAVFWRADKAANYGALDKLATTWWHDGRLAQKQKPLRYCYRRGFEFGGSVEIRTLEPFRVAGFQDRCLQPLGHAS